MGQRVLDPIDRISEVLFGVIMCLTFTGAISVTTSGDDERALLVAALGCNLAWGIVDGVMFLTMGIVERAHGLRTLAAVRDSEPARGRQVLAEELPPVVAGSLDDGGLENLRRNVAGLDLPPRPRIRRQDVVGAAAVAALVFLSTFPMVVPFLLVDDQRWSIRLSNLVAMAMLAGCGLVLGRYAGARRPWRFAAVMTAGGMVLVSVTVALGG